MVPSGLVLRNFRAKWHFLRAQRAFQLAPLRTSLRLVSWRIRCLLGQAATIDLRRWRVRIFLPPDWRGVGKLIYTLRDFYEPELAYLEKLLSPGQVFVDAGANFGIYTAMASRIVGSAGQVICFEPSSRAFPILQHNIAINRFNNVLAFPIALTDKTGRAQLYHHPAVGSDALSKDSTFDPDAYAQEVETESLDDALGRTAVDQVHVIKMDVQGAEELALRGAREIILSTRPVIMFEFHPQGALSLGLEPHGAWNLLAAFGYDFLNVGQGGTATRLTCPPSTIANIVAIHRSST